MKYLSLISLVFLVALQAGAQICTFSAEIRSVEICQPSKRGIYEYDLKSLKEAKETTIVVGADARWSIKATVKSIEGDAFIFRAGSDVTIVVHSPVQSFFCTAEEAKGKIVRFDLFGSSEKPGYISFHMLREHIEEEANQRPERNAGATSVPTTTPPAGVAHP